MEYAGDWREQAECRDADPEIFFPLGDIWQPGEATAAKAICWGCPVSQECLTFALASGDAWSVAGGMTPVERSQLSWLAA